MSEYEQRAEIMDLVAVMDKKRAEFQEVVNEFKRLISALISTADKMMPAATDASPENEGRTVRRVVYKRTESTVPEEEAAKATSGLPEPPPVLEKGKRACSVCRRPGHRAQNCPTVGQPVPVAQKGRRKK